MTRCSKMKILFCIKIFVCLFNVIASNADIFHEKMSLEERRSFFGTKDGSVPEYEIVELVRPSRSKRSTKDPIEITFHGFGTLLTAALYIVEDHDLISRSLTGIWGAQTNLNAYQKVAYIPMPQIFDDIGDFDLYQNADEGSAVARFRDSEGNENILGLLKQNYTVKSVPKEFEYALIDINRKHVIGKRSENSLNDDDKKSLFLAIFKSVGIPEEYFRRNNYAKNDAIPDPRLHRPKRQSTNPSKVPDVVYPKILIIPDYSVIERYPQLLDFLKHLIAQINCVDMMYRQLKDPEVHLNIAGIILPRSFEATPYIQENMDLHFRMRAYNVLEAAQLNFYNEQRRFPHKAWDSVVMLTTYPMDGIDDQRNVTPIDGTAQMNEGCTGGAAVCLFVEGMWGVHVIAHELGHLFGVGHDDKDIAMLCKNDDGYTMSQNYWVQKLEWSNCSRAAFQTYFRSNQGNCGYSRPKEMSDVVKNMPGAWLPLPGQCDNLYTDSTNACGNYPNSCVNYDCYRNGTCDSIFYVPMEGSLMDHNGLRACINQMWVPV